MLESHPEPEATEISKHLTESLKGAAEETLPQKSKSEKDIELWKNDKFLNELLEERSKLTMNTSPYKVITKKVK